MNFVNLYIIYIEYYKTSLIILQQIFESCLYIIIIIKKRTIKNFLILMIINVIKIL